MMWIGIAVAGVIGSVLLWLFVRSSKYKAIFADEHFLEIAAELPPIKQHAYAMADDAPDRSKPPTDDDPRMFVSSQGLIVMYTIGLEEGEYEQHVSVSLDTGYTAGAVGEMFTHWLLYLLSVDLDHCVFVISPSRVHFASWRVEPEALEQLAAAPVLEPTADDVARFREHWREAREKVQCNRMVDR